MHLKDLHIGRGHFNTAEASQLIYAQGDVGRAIEGGRDSEESCKISVSEKLLANTGGPRLDLEKFPHLMSVPA